MKRMGVIGVPSSAGARRTGQERAPWSFRRAGLVEKLATAGRAVVDLGDEAEHSFRPDPDHPKARNLEGVVSVVHRVADRVRTAAREGSLPLVLGGDCTISLGVVAGLVGSAPRLGLVYFDGDVDLNTPETTSSGIFDGMVLSHMTGRGAPALARSGPRHPLLPEEDIVVFGYNTASGSVDAAEVDALQRSRFARYPVSRVRGRAGEAAREALADLEETVESVVVHFDVDVVDFDDFPAADVPHRGGLSFDDAMRALEVFAGSRRLAGLVVTEFNSDRDPDGRLAARLVDGLTGALNGRSSRPAPAA